MISICIPVYNYDVRKLVFHLHRQATTEGIAFEILLYDDASVDSYKILNRECTTLPHLHLTELTRNAGRSAIRNLLAKKAKYPWLIFMDCDSECPDDAYIKKYISNNGKEGVVCGGRIYHSTPPNDDTYLHWLFGTRREVKPCLERAKKPNHSFMTNNFMISASIMKKIRFNESLLGYGHEDTLFGLELLKNNIHIRHIDNPLIHVGLQNSREFLCKTREGTRNLLKVYAIVKRDKDLPEMVKLLKMWSLLRRLGLCYPTGSILKRMESTLERNLTGKRPRMLYLDLYKLGLICRQTIRFRRS
ncbi:MAG: glycosyltransferase family 2 protein [Bacteroidota bacterium]